jgi:hypothetical protein
MYNYSYCIYYIISDCWKIIVRCCANVICMSKKQNYASQTEKCEDVKVVIRSRKSKKDRQYRDKKVWQKESDQQNT